MTYNEVLKKAIDTYGKDNQIDMMIEEMSELTKALLKYRRKVFICEEVGALAIIEEIADVQIVLDQMSMIFDEAKGKEYWMRFKTQRLARNIGLEEEVTGETK